MPIPIRVDLMVSLPDSAHAWELYANTSPPLELVNAVCQLNLAMVEALGAIGRGMKVQEAYKTHVEPVMAKHRNVGANDTEPRTIAYDILFKFAKRVRP